MVQGTPGVADAAGQVGASGAVVIDGKTVTTGGAPTLVYSTTPDRFSPSTYVSGGPPTKNGQVSINTKLAQDKNLKVGDRIGLTTAHGVKDVTISGVFNFGNSTSIGGATLVQTTLADAQALVRHGRPAYEHLGRCATAVCTPEQLATRLKAALPAYTDVKTGQQTAQTPSKAVSDALGSVLTPALLAFGGVAIIVGAFIIFNAFSITVAQRTREFAMLRSLGASRRQVLLTVLGEALVMGVVASVVGLLAGLGVAKGINALFKAVGADIPTAGLTLEPRTIIVALSVGIGVAVLAAMTPALRATRVPPVAALQEGASLPESFISRHSSIIAAVFVALGVLALARGLFGSDPTSLRLLFLGGGVILIFIAVAVMSKYVVRPVAGVVGWPLAKVAPTSGVLARENTTRNPARTAATAAALMIGLAVVVFVAVFAQGLKASFVDALDRSLNASIVISGQNGAPIPAKTLGAVMAVPSVEDATSLSSATVQVNNDGTASMDAVEPGSFAPMWRFRWLRGGSDALVGKLNSDAALVEEQFALRYKLKPGSSFTAMSSTGEKATLKVIGEYRDPVLMTGFTVAKTTFDSFVPETQRDPIIHHRQDAPATRRR